MPQNVDILLVTATSTETNAVLAVFRTLCGTEPKLHQVADRTYLEIGKVSGNSVWLLQCQMGSGGVGASLQAVTKAITSLSPGAAIMVGIAMGVDAKRQSIGDILVSKKITLYENRRMGAHEIVRGDRASASGFLLSRFETAMSLWRPDPKVKVRTGLLLTGEKVIDDVEYRSQLIGFEPDAIGAEMEGAGLYVACVDAGVPWIVVKAICDWGDGNKKRKKVARQTLAATNAATFVLHALNLAPLFPSTPAITGATVGHLYWLGSDLADGFHAARNGEPPEAVARALTQAARHLRKAGLREPAIEDRLPLLAAGISILKPEQWRDIATRKQVADQISEVKGQVNIFINTTAGRAFDPNTG